ncbi:division site determinant MinD [Beggiatoa sp. SS]|nr:division site determinant MinD [Beggiatoa sp. SS]
MIILHSSQTHDTNALPQKGVARVLTALKQRFDFIIGDSRAGNEHGVIMACLFAEEAGGVMNPEVSSVRDSDRIIGMLSSKTRRAVQNYPPVKEHLLVTRYSPKRVDTGDMLSVEDVQEILAIPLVGIIPESPSVLQASNSGIPVVLEKNSDAGQAYLDVVARFLGEEPPSREKKGFLTRLFGN